MNIQKLKIQTLYENLKTQIISQTLPENSKLPSEAELMEQYDMSRYAIRKVIEQLSEEQLVRKHQGKGVFVCQTQSFLKTTSTSKQILLIASRAEHFYFLKSINGIENALQDSGYSLTIKLSNYNPEVEANLLKEAFSADYAGFLIFPSESAYIYTNLYLYKYIESNRIPCVLLGNKIPCVDLPYVISDDYMGGSIAAQHFIKNGHRSFTCVMNREEYSGCMRYAGFLDGVHRAGLSVDTHDIFWFGHREKDSFFKDRRDELLSLASKSTAFFCFNDAAAVNLYHLLAESGYRIPEDVSIIGYDDSYLCETNPLPLTALHQDPEDAGYIAVSNLLHLIKNETHDCCKIFHPYLVERKSVARIN